MPSGRSNSTTGRCRNLPSYIMRSALPNGSSGCTVCGWAVMTSATRVRAGLRPSATNRNSASRSVKIPIRRVPSTTSSAPTLCRIIRRAASTTVVVFDAVIGVCAATIERSDRIGMRDPPCRMLAPQAYAASALAQGGPLAQRIGDDPVPSQRQRVDVAPRPLGRELGRRNDDLEAAAGGALDVEDELQLERGQADAWCVGARAHEAVDGGVHGQGQRASRAGRPVDVVDGRIAGDLELD